MTPRPKAADPETESPVATAPAPEPPVEPEQGSIPAPEGHLFVTYVGHAERLTYGELILKPGIPTPVSKDLVEVLLTTPFEEFTVAGSLPVPPENEE
jgi:hypothetical protein